MLCSLCGSQTTIFSEIHHQKYFNCSECSGISLHPEHFLSADAEKERYQLHNNDISDLGYQKFVSPITLQVLEEHNPDQKGLDFGSGSGPVITSLLREKAYNITTYDPFFDANKNALENRYDYIVCCEVMEHFCKPYKEFKLLHSLLHPQGVLYCKTVLYNHSIDFESWWYKNDPTHVFFYTADTLNWIKEKFGFKSVEITTDLIIFRKQ